MAPDSSLDIEVGRSKTVNAHGRTQRSHDDSCGWRPMTPKLRATLAVMSVGALLATTAACSSDNKNSSSGDSNTKVELTFWSWVPGIDKVVAQWNTAHPNVHVTVSKQAQGDEEVTKV